MGSKLNVAEVLVKRDFNACSSCLASTLFIIPKKLIGFFVIFLKKKFSKTVVNAFAKVSVSLNEFLEFIINFDRTKQFFRIVLGCYAHTGTGLILLITSFRRTAKEIFFKNSIQVVYYLFVLISEKSSLEILRPINRMQSVWKSLKECKMLLNWLDRQRFYKLDE